MAGKPKLEGKNVTRGRVCKQAYKKNTKRQFLNPFFVFLKEYRKTCKLIKTTEVAKSAGAAWRSMNRMEKEPYIIKSEELREIDEAREMKMKADKRADGNKDPDKKRRDKIEDNEEVQRELDELNNDTFDGYWKYGGKEDSEKKDSEKKDSRKKDADNGTSNE